MNEVSLRGCLNRESFALGCRVLYERHLVTGVGGNVSARIADGYLTTPSGICLRDMTPDDVLPLDKNGEPVAGGKPSKEFPMHRRVFDAKDEVKVVCHVHGNYIIAASTIFAPGDNSLPPVTPGFCFFAYPLPLLPFHVPGSTELADAVGQCFRKPGRCAALLQNHGLITAGQDMAEAINIAEEIDEAAQVYILTGGKCTTIPEEDISEIIALARKSTS